MTTCSSKSPYSTMERLAGILRAELKNQTSKKVLDIQILGKLAPIRPQGEEVFTFLGYLWSLFGKHGSGLEMVYTLSCWLMSSPPSYHIKLLSGDLNLEPQSKLLNPLPKSKSKSKSKSKCVSGVQSINRVLFSSLHESDSYHATHHTVLR
ncbi:hypothetical protein SLEP1_g27031 [Rubroshorea leprosula]|uniref:Uncharacterized protein n=1 Tax=Rubroshorea leprosula TaxID=152421 RepID=A0AAV5K0F1_9ROSI|nr:hypothetical protein SLEP1_g27031 [Rubroshorea leprosula]